MVDLQPKGRCVNCRYDLRGITSKVCPECGTRTDSVAVRIMDSLQYHRARAALSHHGLLRGSIDPGGTLGSAAVAEGFHVAGWVWVDPDRLEEVEACLDSAGVFWQVRPVPIVDRSDPTCPSCGEKLNIDGPEECENCGDVFQWVDVANEPLDPTGLTCDNCGYELTGNASGLCPECGFSVEASILPPEAFAGHSDQSSRSKRRGALRMIVFVLIELGALILFLAILLSTSLSHAFIYLSVGILGLGLAFLIILRKHTARKNEAADRHV